MTSTHRDNCWINSYILTKEHNFLSDCMHSLWGFRGVVLIVFFKLTIDNQTLNMYDLEIMALKFPDWLSCCRFPVSSKHTSKTTERMTPNNSILSCHTFGFHCVGNFWITWLVCIKYVSIVQCFHHVSGVSVKMGPQPAAVKLPSRRGSLPTGDNRVGFIYFLTFELMISLCEQWGNLISYYAPIAIPTSLLIKGYLYNNCIDFAHWLSLSMLVTQPPVRCHLKILVL